jgi:hypothetical protein
MATADTICDTENATKSSRRPNTDEAANYIWKLYIDLGTEGNQWSPLLKNDVHRNTIKRQRSSQNGTIRMSYKSTSNSLKHGLHSVKRTH